MKALCDSKPSDGKVFVLFVAAIFASCAYAYVYTKVISPNWFHGVTKLVDGRFFFSNWPSLCCKFCPLGDTIAQLTVVAV